MADENRSIHLSEQMISCKGETSSPGCLPSNVFVGGQRGGAVTTAEKVDSRRGLSSNVLVEGGNDRVGGHAAHVRHSCASRNPGNTGRAAREGPEARTCKRPRQDASSSSTTTASVPIRAVATWAADPSSRSGSLSKPVRKKPGHTDTTEISGSEIPPSLEFMEILEFRGAVVDLPGVGPDIEDSRYIRCKRPLQGGFQVARRFDPLAARSV